MRSCGSGHGVGRVGLFGMEGVAAFFGTEVGGVGGVVDIEEDDVEIVDQGESGGSCAMVLLTNIYHVHASEVLFHTLRAVCRGTVSAQARLTSV